MKESSSGKVFGLLGKKLGHSYSPRYFKRKFEAEGIEARYELFELSDISELPELLRKNRSLEGLNVTIPYKESVMALLDEISPEAQGAGAVNVISIKRNGDRTILKGHNTDILGFKESLRRTLKGSEGHSALVLGTGGASKAVAVALEDCGIPFRFVSSHPAPGMLGYDEIDRKILEKSDLIINTTPLGMFPDIESAPAIPYEYLDGRHYCLDLVYNPEETLFMKRASSQGATVKNGMEMLELQAEASWKIWNGE